MIVPIFNVLYDVKMGPTRLVWFMCSRPTNQSINSFELHEYHCHPQEVFLSIVWSSGKLGAAFYKTDTTEFYMIPDAAEKNDFLSLKRGLCVDI